MPDYKSIGGKWVLIEETIPPDISVPKAPEIKEEIKEVKEVKEVKKEKVVKKPVTKSKPKRGRPKGR